MKKIEEKVLALKSIVDHLVPEKYRKFMYYEAVKMYRKNYLICRDLEFEQGKNYNPFENTVNNLIYEINSRKLE